MLTRSTLVIAIVIAAASLAPVDAHAGSFARAVGRGALRGVSRSFERGAARSVDRSALRSLERGRLRDVTRRDLLIHNSTRPAPITNPREVFRFTTRERAFTELRQGIAPNRHMTTHSSPGRPLSAESAMRRYGLPAKPDVRETIVIPSRQPIRSNKVVGGAPGVGEVTSPKLLPPEAIKKIVPVR
jgi:hypothetical protein